MFRDQKKLGMALGAIVALGLAASPSVKAAPIQNGSFENAPDFVNFTTIGNTSIQLGGDFTATAPDGSQEAYLSNSTNPVPGATGAVTGAAGLASLDAFVNLSAGTLEGQGVKSGSALKQTFTAAAGDTLTFSFKFATNDLTNADFAFVTLQGPGSGTTQTNFFNAGSSPSAGLVNTATSVDALFGINTFSKETGFLTEQVTVGAAGTYTLAIGVTNASDTVFESGLVVDNIVQAAGTGGTGGSGVPLPAGMYLMPLGLAVAGLFSSKLRRAAV